MSDGPTAEEIRTADTMRERSGESQVKLWVLLRTRRAVVAACIAAAFFAGFMAFSVVLDPSLQSRLQNADTVETMFSTMIGVIVTGTTLVVTINQLVLSQELGPLGDQRARMSGTLEYRSFMAEIVETTVPAEPSAFLRALVESTERRVEVLDRLVQDDDDELAHQVDAFTESLHGNAKEVEDQLDGAEFGNFEVVAAALNFNYSWQIYQIDRMTDEFDDVLSSELRTAFEDLKQALSMFGAAREHVKTLYFQSELIDLSRYIIYAAIPALVVAGGMLAFVTGDTFTGQVLGVPTVTWVVGVALTVTLLPYFLFAAYILRIVTIAKRTLAIGPLVLRN